jgi:hypothetical protein
MSNRLNGAVGSGRVKERGNKRIMREDKALKRAEAEARQAVVKLERTRAYRLAGQDIAQYRMDNPDRMTLKVDHG